VSQLLASRNIQFKTTGQDSWASGTYFNNGRAGLIVFRVRPDHYWEVLISSGITSAKLSFDDVEAVNTYVTKQLRTSDSRMVINKVRYE
jgi:hypothetical protein